MRFRRPTINFVAFGGFVSIAAASGLALITGKIFVFPSLGPTAYLHFHDPMVRASCPRNTICGHALGIVCGALALWVTGLWDAPSAMSEGVTLPRVLAAALSLSATSALMIWLDLSHPPAASTTLMVSLGLLNTPSEWLVLEGAVILLTILGFCLNRLAGLPYPVWAPVKT